MDEKNKMLPKFLSEWDHEPDAAEIKSLRASLSPEERAQIRHNLAEDMIAKGSYQTYQDLWMQSQSVDCYRDRTSYGGTVSLHAHPFAELLYANSGEAQYLLGGRLCSVCSGDAVFIPPNTVHSPIFPGAADETAYYDRIVIWVNNDILQNVKDMFLKKTDGACENLLRNGFILHVDRSENISIKNAFFEICQEAEKAEDGWQLVAGGLGTALVARMLRAALKKPQKAAAKEKLVEKVLEYIEQNLSGRITLENTAGIFHLSVTALNKRFREQLHTSFYHYVLQRRLNEAKILIAGSVPLTNAAEQTGFCDYSAFYRAFKKEFGISPSRYKNLTCELHQQG